MDLRNHRHQFETAERLLRDRLSSSSVSINGPVLTLNLAINFKAAFSGTKDVRMFANALGDLTTGWQSRGSWIVP